tara:strand:+ start:6859 stop:8247 length:1389 start_codon:yes stop_codon:yes gene_type:complete
MSENIYNTDWLGTIPIFYNEDTNSISSCMKDVIDKNKVFFDKEGLINFLDFGYSVFNQTPIKGIKFIGPSQSIKIKNNKIKIENEIDPLEELIDNKLKEDEIFELIHTKVLEWEKSLPSDYKILLPLSGGYDSRILLNAIENKERVYAFTYGLSSNQKESYEVVRAKYLCKKFGIKWKQIYLGQFNKEIEYWISKYGLSTHAHGMYQVEFYKKIKELYPKEKFAVLSGIVGDLWAGSLPNFKIRNFEDLNFLGLTRGHCAESSFLKYDKNKVNLERKKSFFEENKFKLQDPRYQIIILIRTKIILLSYLLNVPRYLGYLSWSPFLEIDLATAMINLSDKRRKNRKWQLEFLRMNNLDLENRKFKYNKTNLLDYNSVKELPLEPLDCELFSDLIDIRYIDFINNNIRQNKFSDYKNFVLSLPKIGTIMKTIGFRSIFYKAYYAYLCLRPIQYILKEFNSSKNN